MPWKARAMEDRSASIMWGCNASDIQNGEACALQSGKARAIVL